MFRSTKVFKKFVADYRVGNLHPKEIGRILKTMPIKVLRRIGKEIIYSDYDGYNEVDKESEMAYFNNLDRWQKEFFIKERLYKLL